MLYVIITFCVSPNSLLNAAGATVDREKKEFHDGKTNPDQSYNAKIVADYKVEAERYLLLIASALAAVN